MAYADKVIAKLPTVFYKLDETALTSVVDYSGNASDGTFNGSPTLSAANLTPSENSTSVDFDGVDDSITTAFTPPAGNWSIALTFEYNPTTGLEVLAGQTSTATERLFLQLDYDTDLISFVSENTTATVLTFHDKLISGNVYHVVFGLDGSDLLLNVNGTDVPQLSLNAAMPPVLPIVLGSTGDAADGGFFTGRMANFHAYDFRLTLATMQELHAAWLSNVITSHAETILALSPIVHYRLNETSGVSLDDAGTNDIGGVYNNSPNLSASSLIPSENSFSAVSFDGVDDYANVSHSAVLSPAGDASISFVFKTLDAIEGLVFSKANLTSPFNGLAVLNSSVINKLTFRQSLTDKVDSVNDINDGVARVFTLVRRTNDLEIWVNGIKEASFTASSPIAETENQDLYIMGRALGALVVAGTIDDVALFPTALDESDIQALNSTVLFDSSQDGVVGITGTLVETLAATNWNAYAYDLGTGDLTAQAETSGTEFVIEMPDHEGIPHFVTVVPEQGEKWIAGAFRNIGDKVFPTNPSETPYYYQCVTTGSSSGSEPFWGTGVGSNTTDGGAVWENVERLIQPITHSPLFPSSTGFAATPPDFEDTVLSFAPSHYWRMDEEVGETVIVDSVGSSDGVMIGLKHFLNCNSMTPNGASKGGIKYRRSTHTDIDHVSIQLSEPSVTQFSIAGVFAADGFSTNTYGIFDLVDTTQPVITTYYAVSMYITINKLTLKYIPNSGSPSVFYQASSSYNLNNRYEVKQFVVVINATAMELYINGVLISTTPITPEEMVLTANHRLNFGHHTQGAAVNRYGVAMEKFAFFDHAIDVQTVELMYAAFSKPDDPTKTVYRNLIESKHPTAYLPMEATPPVEVVNGEIVTVSGTLISASSLVASEAANNSITFDGTSYLDVALSNYHTSSEQSFVFTMQNHSAVASDIFSLRDLSSTSTNDSQLGVVFGKDADGGHVIRSNTAEGVTMGSSPSFVDQMFVGTTIHIALTFGARTGKLFVYYNGVASSPNLTISTNTDRHVLPTLTIGAGRRANNIPTNFSNVTIDNFAMFDRVLSQEEVTEIYNATL